MKSPDHFLYEYSVVRYVPRIDREEFLNIGLIMMCKRQKWLKGKISINTNKIISFDPHVNLVALEKQSLMFENKNLPDPILSVEEKYRWLAAVKSAVLQTSPSHPGTISETDNKITDFEILEKEFNRLFHQLVE